jgi:hypothetical protein
MGDSGVYVKVTGGLGNQLFGLAAGIEQATRLKCRLVLLRDNFKPDGHRRFWLDKLALPDFVEIGNTPAWFTFGKPRALFREQGFNFDPRVFEVKPGTVMEGYFQSPKYFTNTRELVASIVFPSNSSGQAHKLTDQDFTAIHVRRGDYLVPETRLFHGLMSKEYFKRALGLLEDLHGRNRVIAFSDSPDHVAQEISELGLKIETFDPQSQLDALATLRTMSQASRFVMSNSSYSWWAAWHIEMAHLSDPKWRVVAPRPWFAGGDSAMDLLLPSWISLG